MTTLGGDLIRMLAHGGINTLSNVGAQYLGNYFQEKAKEKLLGLQTNLEAAGVEADPNIQQQILQQIKGPLRLATVRQEGMAPIGEAPSIENLGMRKGLTYPGATYAPAAVERIVSPVPSMEALKSKVAMGLPGAERKTALFPKEDTLAMTYLKAEMDRLSRESEGALNRQSREDMAKDANATRLQIAQGMQQLQAAQQAQTQQWRDTMKQNMKEKIGLLKDVNEQKQLQGDLGKLTVLEGKIIAAKKPEEKKMFMAQANEHIKNSKALAGYPMWEEEVPIPGTGITLPLVGEVGRTTQKVPVGQKPSAAPKAPTPTPTATPTLSAIQEEKRRRGLIK